MHPDWLGGILCNNDNLDVHIQVTNSTALCRPTQEYNASTKNPTVVIAIRVKGKIGQFVAVQNDASMGKFRCDLASTDYTRQLFVHQDNILTNHNL